MVAEKGEKAEIIHRHFFFKTLAFQLIRNHSTEIGDII